MMESNKDEAYHCLEIAEKYIHYKDLGKARKFLKKSLALYPSQEAEDLLQSIKDLPYHTTLQYFRQDNVKLGKTKIEHPSLRSEEIDGVINRILTSSDHHEILGVEKYATDEEIKRRFKKLALLIHPDKTHRPGAADAFRTIRNAVAILTDHPKRRLGDASRLEGTNSSAKFYNFRSEFPENNSDNSEESSEHSIFKETDGGLYEKSTKPEKLTIKFILPIIFAIALTCVTTLFMHDPSYSLQKSLKYPLERHTHNLKIPYYVKENFLMDNSGLSITQLENEIEVDTITNLQYACYKERSHRNYLLQVARERKNSKHLTESLNTRLPSCEKLYEMQRVLYM